LGGRFGEAEKLLFNAVDAGGLAEVADIERLAAIITPFGNPIGERPGSREARPW
jgi:hypothetical protein